MRLLKSLLVIAVALSALLVLPSARSEPLHGFGKIEMKPLDGGVPGYSLICEPALEAAFAPIASSLDGTSF